MTDSKEADELRKQIAFLTDLINKAKQEKPKLASSSSCPDAPGKKVFRRDHGHGGSTATSHTQRPWLDGGHSHPSTQTGFHSGHLKQGHPEEIPKSSKYCYKRNLHASSSQSVPVSVSSVTTSNVLNSASDQSLSQITPKMPASCYKTVKSVQGLNKSGIPASCIVKISNKKVPSSQSVSNNGMKNVNGASAPSNVQTTKLPVKSAVENNMFFANAGSSVKAKISECSDSKVNVTSNKQISNSFARLSHKSSTTIADNLVEKNKIETSGSSLTGARSGVTSIPTVTSTDTSIPSIQSSKVLSGTGRRLLEENTKVRSISGISEETVEKRESPQRRTEVNKTITSIEKSSDDEIQHKSVTEDSLLLKMPKVSRVQQQETLKRGEESVTILPRSDDVISATAPKDKGKEAERYKSESVQKTKTPAVSSVQASQNNCSHGNVLDSSSMLENARDASSSSNGSISPHKHSLTQLLRKNAKSTRRVDLVIKFEQSHCRLEADFIPLHSSSTSDNGKVTTVDDSNDSSVSGVVSSSSNILDTAECSSQIRGISTNSVISLSSDSSDSLPTAVTSSPASCGLSDTLMSVKIPINSVRSLEDPSVAPQQSKTLISGQTSVISSKAKNDTQKDKVVASKESTSNKYCSVEQELKISGIQRLVSEKSVPLIQTAKKSSSNLSSAISKISLPKPASPLRLQNVATLMSDLQKTQSKIEHLKENIGGILQKKLQCLPEKSQIMTSTISCRSKQMKRANAIDKRKLLKQKQLLKQKTLLGKIWVREKAESPAKIAASTATGTVVKSKYRLVKGLKSVSRHSLVASKSFHFSSEFNEHRHSAVPGYSNSQHAAKVIVGKYKISRYSLPQDGIHSHSFSEIRRVEDHKGITKATYNSTGISSSIPSRTNKNLQWTLHKVWSNKSRKGDYYNAGLSWNKGPWWRQYPRPQTSKQKAEHAHYIRFIKGLSRPSTSTRRLKAKASRKKVSTSSRVVVIDGILYKASGSKLIKTGSKSVDHRKLTRSKVATSVVTKGVNAGGVRTVSVRGVTFYMDASGYTLRRVRSAQEVFASTSAPCQHSFPKMRRLDIGGTTYIQTKPGTLIKSSSIRTRAIMSRIKNRSILSATAKFLKDATKNERNLCKFYNRFGRCRRGKACPYTHDPDRIAVCTRFLRGTCKIQGCPFSHKASREKVPVCSYFLRGVCTRDKCPYLHVKVNRNAAVCPDFINGFCPQGEQCKKQHTTVCPVFSRTGACPQGTRCKMVHRRRKPRALKPTSVSSDRDPSRPSVQSGGQQKRSARDAGVDDHDDATVKRRDLPSFISLEHYNVDDLLLPPAVAKETTTNKGPTLRIKPQL